MNQLLTLLNNTHTVTKLQSAARPKVTQPHNSHGPRTTNLLPVDQAIPSAVFNTVMLVLTHVPPRTPQRNWLLPMISLLMVNVWLPLSKRKPPLHKHQMPLLLCSHAKSKAQNAQVSLIWFYGTWIMNHDEQMINVLLSHLVIRRRTRIGRSRKLNLWRRRWSYRHQQTLFRSYWQENQPSQRMYSSWFPEHFHSGPTN